MHIDVWCDMDGGGVGCGTCSQFIKYMAHSDTNYFTGSLSLTVVSKGSQVACHSQCFNTQRDTQGVFSPKDTLTLYCGVLIQAAVLAGLSMVVFILLSVYRLVCETSGVQTLSVYRLVCESVRCDSLWD